MRKINLISIIILSLVLTFDYGFGMAGGAKGVMERAKALREATTPPKATAPTTTAPAPAEEQKGLKKVWGIAKEKAKAVRGAAGRAVEEIKGKTGEVAGKVVAEISPEKKVRDGVVKIVNEDSGMIVNEVVDALRGIKVFPPVTQGVPQVLTDFRKNFGEEIGTFATTLSNAIVNALRAIGAFGNTLEVATGGVAALVEKGKVEQSGREKGLLGRIKTAFSGLFKSKAEVATGRIKNAISGYQNKLSDHLINSILRFIENRFTNVSQDILDSLDTYLRGVIYGEMATFKDSVSNKMVDFLREQGVLK